MTSWKTNLGGSLAALGHFLMASGMLGPKLMGLPVVVMAYVALAGFIISGLGVFFTGLFAQDRICPKPDCPLKALIDPNQRKLPL